MICQYCGKREATTHIRRIVGGEKTELHLCPSCAATMGYGSVFDGLDLKGALSGFFGDLSGLSSMARSVRCEKCGCSFEDIASSGNVGCADCYRLFFDRLLPSVKRIHGETSHCGKLPHSASDQDKRAHRVQELRYELNKAIDEQNFEQAALLRDEIRRLEEQA